MKHAPRLVLFLCVALCLVYLYSCAGIGGAVKDTAESGGPPAILAVVAKFLALAELPTFILVAAGAVIAHLFVENGHLNDTVTKLEEAAQQRVERAHDVGIVQGADSGIAATRAHFASHPNEALGIPEWIFWAVPTALVLYMLWSHSSRFRNLVRGLWATVLGVIRAPVQPPSPPAQPPAVTP